MNKDIEPIKDIEKISEELKEQKKISRALFIEIERLKNEIEKLKEYI